MQARTSVLFGLRLLAPAALRLIDLAALDQAMRFSLGQLDSIFGFLDTAIQMKALVTVYFDFGAFWVRSCQHVLNQRMEAKAQTGSRLKGIWLAGVGAEAEACRVPQDKVGVLHHNDAQAAASAVGVGIDSDIEPAQVPTRTLPKSPWNTSPSLIWLVTSPR